MKKNVVKIFTVFVLLFIFVPAAYATTTSFTVSYSFKGIGVSGKVNNTYYSSTATSTLVYNVDNELTWWRDDAFKKPTIRTCVFQDRSLWTDRTVGCFDSTLDGYTSKMTYISASNQAKGKYYVTVYHSNESFYDQNVWVAGDGTITFTY